MAKEARRDTCIGKHTCIGITEPSCAYLQYVHREANLCILILFPKLVSLVIWCTIARNRCTDLVWWWNLSLISYLILCELHVGPMTNIIFNDLDHLYEGCT